MSSLSIGVMATDGTKLELCPQYEHKLKLSIYIINTQSNGLMHIYMYVFVFILSLVAAVEGHAERSQEADRQGDGCDWQHLSLVHLFALCRETKTEEGATLMCERQALWE